MPEYDWPAGADGITIRLLQSNVNEQLRVRISALESGGGGGGGGAGGANEQVQYNANGQLGASAFLSYSDSLRLLRTPLLGGRVHNAGTVSGTWSPPLGQGAATILASASANFTLAIPSGATLSADHEVYLHLVISNTASTPIYITFDVGANTTQYMVLHKRPLNVVLGNASAEFFVRWLGTRWVLVGPQPQPYPISFQVSGVPDTNAVLFGLYVHNQGLPGGLYVPWRLDDIGNTTCATAPTANTVFSIERSAAGQQPWTQIGTLTFPSGIKDYSNWSFPNGIVKFDHGDRLRIVSPGNLNGLANLTWIMACMA